MSTFKEYSTLYVSVSFVGVFIALKSISCKKAISCFVSAYCFNKTLPGEIFFLVIFFFLFIQYLKRIHY